MLLFFVTGNTAGGSVQSKLDSSKGPLQITAEPSEAENLCCKTKTSRILGGNDKSH